MELQTENGKKKVPLSTGLKWLRLVCMAVVFGIIAGGVMVGMNYLGGSMAAEEESIPQTSTVKVTAKAEDSDAVVAVAREAMPSVVTISTMSVEEMRSFFGGTQEIQVQGAGTGVIVNKNESELLIATNNHGAHNPNINQQNGGVKKKQVKGCGSVNRPTPGSQWPAEPATSGFLQGVNFAIFRGRFGGLGVKLGVVDDRFSQCSAILHGVTIGVAAIFCKSSGRRIFRPNSCG